MPPNRAADCQRWGAPKAPNTGALYLEDLHAGDPRSSYGSALCGSFLSYKDGSCAEVPNAGRSYKASPCKEDASALLRRLRS